MFRLIEVLKTNDKETQSIYEYDTETEALGNYETKLGAAMKADELAHFFVVLNNVGNIVRSAYVGTEEISPRLFDVKATDTEVANFAKYDTVNDVHANFHTKLGNAMKNTEVISIMLRGFDTHGETIEYKYWVRPMDEV